MVDIPDLVWLDATEQGRLIARGEVTAVEVVQAHLDRIEAVDDRVNAFVTVASEQALEAAGRPVPGPLSGVPFTVKDAFDTAGIRTTRGSLLYADHVPTADATAVARLRAAGGIVLAKTNLPEMSYWTETDNRVVGRSLNPYDRERTPGGSSGGESAAIAAGMSPIGLGSDVAISVRGPAHDTGIVAIKPTHGRVPYTGHIPDVLRRWWHVGPMARSVRDLRLALRLVEGPDGIDPYAAGRPAGRSGALTRVGWTSDAFGPVDQDVAATVAAASTAVSDLGQRVEQVQIPVLTDHDYTQTSAILYLAEMLPYLRRLTLGREAELHSVITRTLQTPEPSPADLLTAERDVKRLRAAFTRWWEEHDVLLCPVVTFPAPLHAQTQQIIDEEVVPARAVMRATVPFNLIGLPAVTIPFGASSTGLPIGVQLVSRWWTDDDLLALAQRLETMSPVLGRRPTF